MMPRRKTSRPRGADLDNDAETTAAVSRAMAILGRRGGYECSASNRRGYASACVEAAEDLDSLLSALLAEVPPLTDGLLKAAWLDGFRDEHVRDEESAWPHS